MSLSKITMLFWRRLKQRVWYVIPFQGLCLYICWSGFKGSWLCFFGYVGHNKYWRGSEVSETALIIEPQSVCVLAILWFLEWIFFCFHEDSSSSVRPALFSELGFRVYHRWGVGKWNSKTEIEEANLCACVLMSVYWMCIKIESYIVCVLFC